MDARSDLYSLGVVGYYLATGELPFEGDSVVEVCGHHLHTKPEPPSTRNPSVPSDLEAVLLQCLAKSPDDRPPTAAALSRTLAACADSGGWSLDDASAWWRNHRASPQAG